MLFLFLEELAILNFGEQSDLEVTEGIVEARLRFYKAEE